MAAFNDLTGRRFDRLFVVERAPNQKGRTQWVCWCVCGKTCNVNAYNLLHGLTRSCGCFHKDVTAARLRKDFPVERKMWLRAKFRASLAGIPFSITLTDIKIPRVCPVLGIPLHKTKRKESRDAAPTLDRRNNALGYVPGNVFVISSKANRIKNNATVGELQAVLNYAAGGANG